MDKGTRVIELNPQPSTNDNWKGRVEGDEKQRIWNGRHCESVIQNMNRDLGDARESDYVIVEGGVRASKD